MKLMLGTVEAATLSQTTTKSIAIGRQPQQQQLSAPIPQRQQQQNASPINATTVRTTTTKTTRTLKIHQSPKVLRTAVTTTLPPPASPLKNKTCTVASTSGAPTAAAAAATAFANVSAKLKTSAQHRATAVVQRRRPYKTTSAANCMDFNTFFKAAMQNTPSLEDPITKKDLDELKEHFQKELLNMQNKFDNVQMKLIIEHNTTQKLLKRVLEEVKTNSLTSFKKPRIAVLPVTPFDDASAFNEFEKEIQISEDKFAGLVAELKEKTSSNSIAFIKDSWRYILKDEVAKQFTWHGTGEKKAIRPFSVTAAIKQACCQKYEAGIDENFEKISMRFFQQANNRLMKRFNYSRSKENTNSVSGAAVKSSASSSPVGGSVIGRCVARCGYKMEHSYIRDCARPKYELVTGLAPARTILVRRPPQCPYCHTNPMEESELEDGNQVPVPSFNEIAAKEAMCECARIAKYVKNNNPDDDDWESRITQNGWSSMQKSLFTKVVGILDNDHLGRLANAGRQNEAMQRRVIVDKSSKRLRKALAAVSWDSRLTQWLHALLMDCLPSTYMASYLDILQTLKSKLPTLMDKMLFGRPMNISQELLAPVLKKKWEPIITTTKSRKLTQNAVIIALPSMPTSGPIPPRMQKWYQHLASITQVVQVSLPMTGSSIARQPLEQVAEQIVSLTRVKIQEIRNENPSRSIVLIGFNAGSALALQVALSETVSCVICMGFAFNTLHGTRGSPDDRLLDIKIPILFVIGQNSARTSTEEVESLREKMQSESSLVVVGSADDVLRVPKSRRKIENVTQSMVDTMIVDEVYEFIKKTISNPPGPRAPTVISSSGSNVKHTKAAINSDGPKPLPVQRKRKHDANSTTAEEHSTPTKAKCMTNKIPKKPKVPDVFQVKRKVGRPRTRPVTGATPSTPSGAAKTTQLVTSTPLVIGKVQVANQQHKSNLSPSSITNEDLNLAIQSILSDSNEHDSSSTMNTSSDSANKIVTNFELVAQSKSTPLKTSLINPLKQQLVAPGTPTIGSKIKMIPANQFVQLKPPMQSQSKIYTIKTAAMLNNTTIAGVASGSSAAGIGTIVTTAPTSAISSVQQQIFTLKSPNGQTTQFVTAAAPAQQKYTVVKPAATVGGLDLSNIIDMPIIFADNDGNISDTVAATDISKRTSTLQSNSNVGQLIISQQIIKEASMNSVTASSTGAGTYVINNKPLTTAASKPNKVVFINRNTMKPCPNIISRSNVAQQLPKYTKVVVTNPKTSATTLVQRATTQSTGSSLVSSVQQLNLQTLKGPTAANSPTQTLASSSSIMSGTKQIQILNTAGTSLTPTDKPSQIRNIVVKPGGLKQIPPHLKTQLLNRNLTVRKLVNIVPANKTTNITTTLGQDIIASSANTSSIQTSPKIITLNPINPSAVSVVAATAQPKSSTSD